MAEFDVEQLSACDSTQAVLSAEFDGEVADELELRRAKAHQRACAKCQTFAAQLQTFALVTAPPTANPRPPVLTIAPLHAGIAALGLAIATVNIIVGLPQLFGRNIVPMASPTQIHLARDGALALITAGIAAGAAIRPQWARPLMLIGLVVLAVQVLATANDLSTSAVGSGFETLHVLAVLAVAVCAWTATVTKPRLTDSADS
jgi:hypothetical protein